MLGLLYSQIMPKQSVFEDDDRVPMTYGERATWSSAILVPIATIAYFAIVLPQVDGTSVEHIAWQIPMLIAIAAVIVGTIIATIIGVIASTVGTAIRNGGDDPDESDDVDADIRDQQIERYGDRTTLVVAGAGMLAVLALSMLDAPVFWIGSAVFLSAAAGGTWGAIAKIRAYRGAFFG
jgi:hypothetical protein